MLNYLVKKSCFAYWAAMAFVISYSNGGFFCGTIEAQEVSPNNTIKDKTSITRLTTSESDKPATSTVTSTTNNSTNPHPTSPQLTSPSQQPKPTPSAKTPEKTNSNNRSTILQVPTLTTIEHSWGRFSPSSWRRLQTTVWSIKGGRRISNISETKTVLDSVDEESVTLLEIASAGENKEADGAKPVKKCFDFYNITLSEGMKITNAKPMKIVVDGRIVPCECRIYEQTTQTVTI
jgi:hypothetical protein